MSPSPYMTIFLFLLIIYPIYSTHVPPRTANLIPKSNERSATVLSDSDAATVLCYNSGTVTMCSTMVIQQQTIPTNDSQTLLGGDVILVESPIKTVSVVRISNSLVLACYVTRSATVPSGCKVLAKDEFGLSILVNESTNFCSTISNCWDLSLSPVVQSLNDISNSVLAVMCFTDQATNGIKNSQCVVVFTSVSSTLEFSPSFDLGGMTFGPPSLTPLIPTTFLICYSLRTTVGATWGVGTCRVVAASIMYKSIIPLGTQILHFNGITTPTDRIAAGLMNPVAGAPRALVCYVSNDQDLMCTGLMWKSRMMLIGSTVRTTTGFTVESISVIPVTQIAGTAFVCYSELGIVNCNSVTFSDAGLVTVADNDLSLTSVGVMLTNVTEAMTAPNPLTVGAYIGKSQPASPENSMTSQGKYIDSSLVVPQINIPPIIQTQQIPSDTLSSLACSSITLGDLSQQTVCLATPQMLARPIAPTPPPTPSPDYCNVPTQWMCSSRSDGCSWLGSLFKCKPLTFCIGASQDACNSLVVDYGQQCQWLNNACVAIIPAANCASLTTPSACASDSGVAAGCFWFNFGGVTGCQSTPLCSVFTTATNCNQSPGCRWSGGTLGLCGTTS